MNWQPLRIALVALLAAVGSLTAASEPRRPELPASHQRPASDQPSLARPDMPESMREALRRLENARGPIALSSEGQLSEATSSSECVVSHPIDGAFASGVVDLSRLGFSMNVPADDTWSVSSISFNAVPSCDGTSPSGPPAFKLYTSLTYLPNELELYLSQATAPTEGADLIGPDATSFWWNGYRYDARLGYSSMESPSNEAGEAILARLVGRLAPTLSLDCFHRQTHGSWDDLRGLGIGDIRPLVAENFNQTFFDLAYFAAPRAKCGNAPRPVSTYFMASFWRESDASWIYATAAEIDRTIYPDIGAGYIDAGGAIWSTERFGFAVAAGSGQFYEGAGVERIKELAKALDPNVDFSCFVTTTQLSRDDAMLLGFHPPAPPAGYRETVSWINRQGAAPGCTSAPPTSYSMFWSFADESGGAVIEALIARTESQPPQPPQGAIGEGSIWWTDALGTYYSVAGYSMTSAVPPSRETLVALARQMDPTLDPTVLPGWEALPSPRRVHGVRR